MISKSNVSQASGFRLCSDALGFFLTTLVVTISDVTGTAPFQDTKVGTLTTSVKATAALRSGHKALAMAAGALCHFGMRATFSFRR